ncbi:MAG: Dabb family protein [Smithella sp.]
MLKHIVFFRFREDVREEAIETVSKKLYGLEERIDLIRSIEIGKDVLRRDQSFDLALTITFDSLEEYKQYDVHPAHVEVKNYILSVRKETVSVDYIINTAL